MNPRTSFSRAPPSLSATEAEHVALSTAMRDVIYFINLIQEIQDFGIKLPHASKPKVTLEFGEFLWLCCLLMWAFYDIRKTMEKTVRKIVQILFFEHAHPLPPTFFATRHNSFDFNCLGLDCRMISIFDQRPMLQWTRSIMCVTSESTLTIASEGGSCNPSAVNVQIPKCNFVFGVSALKPLLFASPVES